MTDASIVDQKQQLRYLDPDRVERNPDNPRLFFRSEELDTLLASIKRLGIQVPITVYAEADHFVLIDGERRWRCSKKLNLSRVPALVQPKPTPLNNLLLMFNIHALREQWDYLTIANKLPAVIELFEAENNRQPGEKELSEITGLTQGQVRRCRFLISLPKAYRRILEAELEKPKNLQVLSEDFFIEMERALKTVQSRVPAALPNEKMNEARNALISKFRNEVINNITDFRKVSKIATSIDNLGVRESRARNALTAIFDPDNGISIDKIYSEHFESRYDQRKIGINVDSLLNYLGEFDEEEQPEIPDDLAERLRRLATVIRRLLG